MKAVPLIRWAGGKTQLLPELRKRVPAKFGRYFEPFIGGGALYFDLLPREATISDVNPELVNLYRSIRDDVGFVTAKLQEHRALHSEAHYYAQRDAFNAKQGETWDRAARLIYLNKAGFNGLYRTNASGGYNVPWGKRKEFVVDAVNLKACRTALADPSAGVYTVILQGDFETIAIDAKGGDFVYFDPPYVPLTQTSSFTRYAKGEFGMREHERLRDVARRLKADGVHVMLSNSDTPLVRALYTSDYFRVEGVRARRSINSKGSARGAVGEVIIT